MCLKVIGFVEYEELGVQFFFLHAIDRHLTAGSHLMLSDDAVEDGA